MYDIQINLKDSKTKKKWSTYVRYKNKMTHSQLCKLVKDTITVDMSQIALEELVEEGKISSKALEEMKEGFPFPTIISYNKAKTVWNEKMDEMIKRISFTPEKGLSEDINFPFKEELFETTKNKDDYIVSKTREELEKEFAKRHFNK